VKLGFNRNEWLEYLAKENIVPVIAPDWAKYPFELRRNEKTIKRQIGRHFIGKETTPQIIQLLGVSDEKSCKDIREYIISLRQIRNYR
jgi:hypothetical protein